ncbi:MAG: hypothetical protein ACKVOB_02250 [Sphingomonas sp.]
MVRIIFGLFILCSACGAVEQPNWAETVAAYEVPLPTDADKGHFLDLLRKEAEAQGYHVDASTPRELEVLSEVSPITFSAAVWRGKDDEEPIASAMDFNDRIGRVWIAFSRGQNIGRSAKFREGLVPKIKSLWPETVSLPIMPSGAIPLTGDLIRTSSGYVVNPAAEAKYSNEVR